MKHILFNLIARGVAPAMLLAALPACESVYDDLDECRTEHRLQFQYDYNMKFADAFPAEVNSVDVWAFDKQGKPVWKTSQSGDALHEKGFYVDLPLQPGVYDFIAWCGLKDNTPFSLNTYDPSSITDLSVDLLLKGGTKADEYTGLYSNAKFSGLYHAFARDVEITTNPDANEVSSVQLSLMKDTKYVKVLLQNLDGTEMRKEDFSINITAANSELAYDNEVVPGTPEFRYEPWMVSEGMTQTPGSESGEITAVSSILAELSTSRLMAGSKSILNVVRNSDGKKIISIPFIQYLLLVKGNYRPMSDQEYLDRQDEYSLTFFIDKGMSWYSQIGIYINSWHVVPQQDTPLH